jgi:hypothetical protein
MRAFSSLPEDDFNKETLLLKVGLGGEKAAEEDTKEHTCRIKAPCFIILSRINNNGSVVRSQALDLPIRVVLSCNPLVY